MTIYATALRYDRALSRPNTWRLLDTRDGVEARVRAGSAPEVTVAILLRHRAGKAPGLVYCRPIDGATFTLEAAVHHPDLPKLELALIESAETAAAVLRAL